MINFIQLELKFKNYVLSYGELSVMYLKTIASIVRFDIKSAFSLLSQFTHDIRNKFLVNMFIPILLIHTNML